MKLFRGLPRWVAILVWSTGFLLVLLGEAIALSTAAHSDTISEVVYWVIGVGEDPTWYFIPARLLLFGLLAWLILHFATRGRV